MKHIAILDFGSQYTHLIARRIREMDVKSEIYEPDVKPEKLKDACGIILSGGPQSVNDEKSPKADPEIFNLGLPILGICYGHQFLAYILGGTVISGKEKEYGKAEMRTKGDSPLFAGVSRKSQIWMSHGDSVKNLPFGFKIIGSTSDCSATAMANEDKKLYGLQFHPEVEHSEEGKKILKNFAFKICKTPQNWKMENILDDILSNIKKQAKNKKVFVLVSGGVDSNVAFSLLTRALGEKKVLGLYIDTGFMRKNETERIKKAYAKAGIKNLEFFDAGEMFFSKLKNKFGPEEKRKIIGKAFLDAKKKAIDELKLNAHDWLLGQGTIYPDTVESGGTKHAQTIKTHHNRVDVIQKLIKQGKVIEPLADFYKDEVRQIGRLLELPKNLIDRHPFPGPGLAVRCLCAENKKDGTLSKTKTKVKKFINKNFSKINHDVLPIKSVGVQGDNRTYAHPLVVWGEKDWEKLDKISSTSTNKLVEINRTVLLLNPKEKVKFEKLKQDVYLTPERIKLLQEIDDIIRTIIKKEKIYSEIWQFPVVLLPITDENGKESIVLRPFNSSDVMTLNFYRMNKNILKKMVSQIEATGKISHIFYDITNKPPGTVEWE